MIKFTYSPLGKALEKQSKTIEDQWEKQIWTTGEHEKQPLEFNVITKKVITVTNYFLIKKIIWKTCCWK